MRRSSACCLAESLGWRPRSLPLARATAMPSRVRIPFVQPVSSGGHGTGVATEGLRRARWPVGSSWASSWSMSTVMVPISPMVSAQFS